MDRTPTRRSPAPRSGRGSHHQRISLLADVCQIVAFVGGGLLLALPVIAVRAPLLLSCIGVGILLLGLRQLAQDRPAEEEGVARLTIAVGLTLIVLSALAPFLLAAGVGACAGLLLLAAALRTNPTPRRRPPALRTAMAFSVTIPVAAGVIFACAGLALAVVVHDGDPSQEDKSRTRKHPTPKDDPAQEVEPEEDLLPTYAESCEALPNPRLIGHDLGELFEEEGAPKAGCGGNAIHVQGTGAWMAAGICDGQLRSVAISAPGREAVILYGEAAEFAWTAGQQETLVAAEAAQPAEGEVDLVEVISGTYGFARSSPSLTQGRENIRWCTEATGRARPFVRLAPPLLLLWRELLQEEAGWSWPTADPSAEPGDQIAFISYPAGELTATGACLTDSDCHLRVGTDRWPGEGSGFVSLPELVPFMPQPVG